MVALAWGVVPTFASNNGYKVFTCPGCVGTAENRATYDEVLAAKPPYKWFMILHEGTTCYKIP